MVLTARDLMQSQLVTVSPEAPLTSIRRLFADEGIHGAPVVDDRGRVVGLVSMSDLLRVAADAHDAARPETVWFHDGEVDPAGDFGDGFEERLGETPVSDVMTPEIVSVRPDASVPEIAMALRSNRVHRVLVMDGPVLEGLISSFDLIELLEKD